MHHLAGSADAGTDTMKEADRIARNKERLGE
jgi:hypothetical protein